jgi:hypothetical protein
MPESPTSTRGPSPTPAAGAHENGVRPPTDQQQFDAVVDRDSRIVLMILGGVAILAALVMSTVALVLSSEKNTSPAPVTRVLAASTAATVKPVTPPLITLSVAGSSKRGPDGKLHDAFSKTNFAVKVGQTTELRINNTDDAPHSITSPEAGVSIIVMPGVHTYSLVARTAGRFEWTCILPCDSEAAGWAMTHPGYMAGYITAT